MTSIFSEINLNDNIILKPEQFDINPNNKITTILKKNIENKVLGRIDGYILIVSKINSISEGNINNINGDISYSVNYDAVVFKPIKNSIINIRITNYNELAIWGIIDNIDNNIQCVCYKQMISDKFDYDEEKDIWKTKKSKSLYGDIIVVKQDSKIDFQIIDSKIDANKILIIGKIL